MQMDPDAVRHLLDWLDEGIYFVDLAHHITWWSKGAERLTGYAPEAIIGTTCSSGLLTPLDEHGQCLCGCQGACPLAVTDGRDIQAEAIFTFNHRHGHQFPARVRALPLRDDHGQLIGAIHTFSLASTPVSDESRLQTLERLVYIDALTGIPNRRFLEETLNARCARMHINAHRFGLVMIDVDHFKRINDQLGHDVGDDVLRKVARTLHEATRPADTLGRWGGEEFLLIAATDSADALTNIAERARQMVERQPVHTGNTQLKVTISVGAALARAGEDMQSIIRRADQVLYASKQAGRNRVQLAA